MLYSVVPNNIDRSMKKYIRYVYIILFLPFNTMHFNMGASYRNLSFIILYIMLYVEHYNLP